MFTTRHHQPDSQTTRFGAHAGGLRRGRTYFCVIVQGSKEVSLGEARHHYDPYHHFKAVTAMTPLQFQKELRLREARRLMLGERFDASTAGARVGYEDASHFNRDYKRFFGAPPRRDVESLRERVG
jgi:methylphosphotriester-DNA--protein-cysteine methyltransferase